MEIDIPQHDNVIHLADFVGGPSQAHRCRHTCAITHVWANLYQCSTSQTSHVCDKNCDQRILYDNHSSVCLVSRKVFPLTVQEREAIMGGLQRKREASCSETGGLKRRSITGSMLCHAPATVVGAGSFVCSDVMMD
eukprot:TRINITY_DN17259_c0_g2_i1.p2 TRINITY_DN17259_c0_g2~~TRINITY_DN17259_c0_g2_i1.p2  ORF type:complete len:136 (+),score=19.09 TRINITY_DN17259_c0_g2_i1:109-516(+)